MPVFTRARVLAAVSLAMIVSVVGMAQTKKDEPREVRIRYGIYTPPSLTISVQSNLIELGVTVSDNNGQAITGLSASDFELFDDGKPRQIGFFLEQRAAAPLSSGPREGAAKDASRVPGDGAPAAPAVLTATHRARYLALVIDDAHGELFSLRKSQLAIESLISDALQPEDHVAIFTTSGAVTLDFTTDAKRLRAAVEGLKPHVYRGDEAITSCPSLTSYQGYAIANNLDFKAKQVAVAEAVACNCPHPPDPSCILAQDGLVQDLSNSVWDQTKYRSANAIDILRIALRHLADAPGDRALVFVSPGFPTGGMEQGTSAIVDAALRNHIVINTLDSEGLLTAGDSPEGRRVDDTIRQLNVSALMSATAVATGGRFVHNSNDLNGNLRTLATVPQASYVLGFTPPANPDGEYHNLKVRLKDREKYKIQARAGYYYSSAPESQSAQKLIDREVASDEEVHQIPIAVRVSPSRTKNGQFAIGVVTTIDASHLKFSKQHGRSLQQLTFVTVLRNSQGDYIVGKEAVMDLLLTTPTLSALRSKGIKTTISLTAPEGSYEVREVVREVVEDHLSASNTPVRCR